MSMLSKLSRFARSPQGRKAVRKVQEYASSPEGKRRIESVRTKVGRSGKGRRSH